MLSQIVEARPLEGYRIYLRFEDGARGVVDLLKTIRLEGVFAPLRERSYFEQVRVHPEMGTICWPNGADLDPDVLHAAITGATVEPQIGRRG